MFVYAWNFRLQRARLWQDLIQLTSSVDKPWLVIGNFNAFAKFEKKTGHENLVIETCPNLSNCILLSSLVDLNRVGSFYTCSNY